MIAEYERAQIAERTRRGKRHKAQCGVVNALSGAPYGYRYVKKTDHADAAYVVDELEAAVVRQVFAAQRPGGGRRTGPHPPAQRIRLYPG